MLTGTKLTPRSNGNAYWENYEEQPGRQRWVDFKQPAYENFTGTRGAYRPYNTTKPKLYAWEPKIAARHG